MKKQKLRYYLRGLGIGVLVTAFILGIAGNEQTMTDAQVRERALELGMVDADSIVLSELQGNDGAEAEEETVAPEAQAEEETAVPETETPKETIAEAEPEATSEVEEDTTEESGEEILTEETEVSVPEETVEAIEEETTESLEESEEKPQSVTITIRSGAGSYTVSKDLAEAGLIEDAGDYDTYLCDNGYSRSIRIGTYEIAVGSTEEEIAKIITGKR